MRLAALFLTPVSDLCAKPVSRWGAAVVDAGHHPDGRELAELLRPLLLVPASPSPVSFLKSLTATTLEPTPAQGIQIDQATQSFLGVKPGTTAVFSLTLANDFLPSSAEVQAFTLQSEVKGDGVTVFGTRSSSSSRPLSQTSPSNYPRGALDFEARHSLFAGLDTEHPNLRQQFVGNGVESRSGRGFPEKGHYVYHRRLTFIGTWLF